MRKLCTTLIMKAARFTYPVGSMYGLCTYIYHENQPNVNKCTSPMDAIGHHSPFSIVFAHLSCHASDLFDLPCSTFWQLEKNNGYLESHPS